MVARDASASVTAPDDAGTKTLILRVQTTKYPRTLGVDHAWMVLR